MGTQLAVIQAIQDTVITVTGIREAPDYPPEQINDFPFAVAFPAEGVHSFSVPGERLFLGSAILEIHVSRADLPTAVENSIGFGDSIPAALMADPTLSGTCDTFEDIQQFFGALNWGDIQTIGYRFTIRNIKIRTNLS